MTLLKVHSGYVLRNQLEVHFSSIQHSLPDSLGISFWSFIVNYFGAHDL